VELGDLSPEDLLPERDDRDVDEMVQQLEEDERYRAIVGQQMNFAVKPGAGSVSKRYKVHVDSPGDPLTRFELEEIR
jgi:hypothetical protein